MTISLNLSGEQEQILASVRALLSDQFPVSRLRGGLPEQGSKALEAMAAFGGLGIALPEQAGGAGLTIVEEVLLHVELGRHLMPPDVLAASLGARLANALGLAAETAAILSGKKRVCLGNALRPFSFDAVEGVPLHLYDPDGADFALVWNETGAVLLDPRKLQTTPVASADRTVGLSLSKMVVNAVIGSLSASDLPLPRFAQLLIAAEFLGMAEAARDMAADYAKIRMQFGQPIGAFQAVKHRCANMAINATVLGAQLVFAAIAERDGWSDVEYQNDACRQLAGRYALENARNNIQVHGGIGFSAECDAHLYLLRAELYQNVGGTRGLSEKRFMARPFPGFGQETIRLNARTP